MKGRRNRVVLLALPVPSFRKEGHSVINCFFFGKNPAGDTDANASYDCHGVRSRRGAVRSNL